MHKSYSNRNFLLITTLVFCSSTLYSMNNDHHVVKNILFILYQKNKIESNDYTTLIQEKNLQQLDYSLHKKKLYSTAEECLKLDCKITSILQPLEAHQTKLQNCLNELLPTITPLLKLIRSTSQTSNPWQSAMIKLLKKEYSTLTINFNIIPMIQACARGYLTRQSFEIDKKLDTIKYTFKKKRLVKYKKKNPSLESLKIETKKSHAERESLERESPKMVLSPIQKKIIFIKENLTISRPIKINSPKIRRDRTRSDSILPSLDNRKKKNPKSYKTYSNLKSFSEQNKNNTTDSSDEDFLNMDH